MTSSPDNSKVPGTDRLFPATPGVLSSGVMNLHNGSGLPKPARIYVASLEVMW